MVDRTFGYTPTFDFMNDPRALAHTAAMREFVDVLGHGDIKTTQWYAHLSPGHLQAEMEKTAAVSPSDSTRSAHGGKIETVQAASPRAAGVAQRQSN